MQQFNNFFNTNRDVYDDSIKNFIQNLIELSEKFINYANERISRDSQNSEDIYLKTSEELINIAYPILINDCFEKTDIIAQHIKKNYLIEKEAIDFFEIQIIMKSILKENINEINSNELKILENILNPFLKITEFKSKLLKKYNHSKNNKITFSNLKDSDQKKYLEEYEKFSNEFFKQTGEFYSCCEVKLENKDITNKILNEFILNEFEE
jgi:hypothetical protein